MSRHTGKPESVSFALPFLSPEAGSPGEVKHVYPFPVAPVYKVDHVVSGPAVIRGPTPGATL